MALQTAIVENFLLCDVDLSVFDFVVIRTEMSALVSCFLQDYPDIKYFLLYVVERPVRYTTKVSEESWKELLRRSDVRDIVEKMNYIRGRLSNRRIKVKISTMTSMSFKAHNNQLLHSCKTITLLWRRQYHQNWEHPMEKKLKVDNGKIVCNNRENDIHTPFLNKRVLVSVKGCTKFWYSLLRDGLHLGQQLKEVWSRELTYNKTLNFTRLSGNLWRWSCLSFNC